MKEKPKDTSPPAFPNPGHPYNGMSLRDYFAAAALTGILANQDLLLRVDVESPETTRTVASVYAYAVADAMLEARCQ